MTDYRDHPSKPNFLIVGAMKSGTTSLWYYLRQHPQIFMPEKKELRTLASENLLLANHGDSNSLINTSGRYCSKLLDEYFSHFTGVSDETAIGEASPQYISKYQNTIPVIRDLLGNPKIIMILRNPVDRTYSLYRSSINMSNGKDYRRRTFEEVIGMVNINTPNKPKLVNSGFYYSQVRAYMENFSNVRIYLYDDLKSDPLSLIKDLFGFLGVDENFKVDVSIKRNVTRPVNNTFQKIIFSEPVRSIATPVLFNTVGEKRSIRLANFILGKVDRNDMKPETRKYLTELYRDNILKLQNLIQRDLTHWLNYRP